MTAIPLSLLPDTAEVLPDGSLSIGGCRCARHRGASSARRCSSTTRRTFGPRAAKRSLRSVPAVRCTRPRRSCARRWPGSRMTRACCSTSPVAARCTSRWQRGSRPTRSPSMATTRASTSFVPPSRNGVSHIVVDSFDELDRLDALHAEGLPVPAVLARITPGVHAHTHEFIATGQDDSKFGFNLGNGDAQRAVDRMRRSAASTWSACTATSAPTCSPPPTLPRRRR